jgi:hypothetical protein
MGYKNPVPSVEDEYVSKKYSITFTFEEGATPEEAVSGINNLITKNGGMIPKEWVRMGEPRAIRYSLPQNN